MSVNTDHIKIYQIGYLYMVSYIVKSCTSQGRRLRGKRFKKGVLLERSHRTNKIKDASVVKRFKKGVLLVRSHRTN